RRARNAHDGDGRLDAAVHGMEGRGYRHPRQGHLLLGRGDQEVGAEIQITVIARSEATKQSSSPHERSDMRDPGVAEFIIRPAQAGRTRWLTRATFLAGNDEEGRIDR